VKLKLRERGRGFHLHCSLLLVGEGLEGLREVLRDWGDCWMGPTAAPRSGSRWRKERVMRRGGGRRGVSRSGERVEVDYSERMRLLVGCSESKPLSSLNTGAFFALLPLSSSVFASHTHFRPRPNPSNSEYDPSLPWRGADSSSPCSFFSIRCTHRLLSPSFAILAANSTPLAPA
jgi:hypothetical protein